MSLRDQWQYRRHVSDTLDRAKQQRTALLNFAQEKRKTAKEALDAPSKHPESATMQREAEAEIRKMDLEQAEKEADWLEDLAAQFTLHCDALSKEPNTMLNLDMDDLLWFGFVVPEGAQETDYAIAAHERRSR